MNNTVSVESDQDRQLRIEAERAAAHFGESWGELARDLARFVDKGRPVEITDLGAKNLLHALWHLMDVQAEPIQFMRAVEQFDSAAMTAFGETRYNEAMNARAAELKAARNGEGTL